MDGQIKWKIDETDIGEIKNIQQISPTVQNSAPGLDNLMDWQPFLHWVFISIWVICANLFIMHGRLHPFILFNS